MRHETVIVGGGIAGAVAAAALARAGRPALLLERSSGPHHKVCGEFLSWEALASLGAVGFDVAPLGPARIERVRLFSGRRSAEAALPYVAAGISRFALDEALLAHAAAAGADIRRGVTVGRAEPRRGGFALVLGDDELAADRLYLATGKSELRGLARELAGQRVAGGFVGFKNHYRLAPGQAAALDGAVELYLEDWGYAGLQHVEGGFANLCLLIEAPAFAACGRTWPGVLRRIRDSSPPLARRLDGASSRFARPLSIAGVPYGFLHAPDDAAPALYRLGDQLGVVHSFTGDGMAMAAAAGLAATSAPSARAFHAEMQKRLQRPIAISAVLQRLLATAPGRAAALAIAALVPSAVSLAARATRVGQFGLHSTRAMF